MWREMSVLRLVPVVTRFAPETGPARGGVGANRLFIEAPGSRLNAHSTRFLTE